MEYSILKNGTQNARDMEIAKKGLLGLCPTESLLANPTETLIDCIMDVLDWFDDPWYEYLYHILAAKTDGVERLARALTDLFNHAATLVAEHLGTDVDYLAPLF